MERRLIDKRNRVLISTIDDRCAQCIKMNAINGYAHIMCPIDNKSCRLGYQNGFAGICYLCSKTSRTTANFKKDILNSYQSLPQLSKLFDTVTRDVAALETKRVNHVVHNLKNLHGHSIQELSQYLPQEQFSYNVNATLDTVKKKVRSNYEAAALTLLRLVKINNGMKAEFSIYEKLIKNDGVHPALSIRPYSFRDVIFLVAQPFFEDFHKKKVWFAIDEFDKKAYFDFETIFSALYHIIGNATKYVEHGTRVEVSFSEYENYYIANFAMSSYHLYEEDVQHMFEEGYSGKLAIEYNDAGQGLGMYRAKLFVEWNNGVINMIAGNTTKTLEEKNYSNNVIELKLPKRIQ